MKPQPVAMGFTRLSVLKIVCLYALFGCLWIALSERWPIRLFSAPVRVMPVNAVKDWLFIILTSLLLYLLLARHISTDRKRSVMPRAAQDREAPLSSAFKIALAVLLPVAAAVLQWLIRDAVSPYVWFLFFPAVFFSGWIGGLAGGLSATAVAAMLGWYLFIPPQFSFQLQHPMQLISIAMFAAMGCLFSYFHHRLQHTMQVNRRLLAAIRVEDGGPGVSADMKVPTTKADDESCLTLPRNGARDFIQKPFVADELPAKVGGLIAERRRAAELHAGESRYLTILRSIGDGVIAADTGGRITLLNPVAEALTGWTETEALGRPLADVFAIVNESSRQPMENPLGKVLREDSVAALSNQALLIAKDGTERPIADSGAPIRTGKGELVGVLLAFRDNTVERAAKRAMEERLQALQLLDAIVNSSSDVIFAKDNEGRYILFNREASRIAGKTVESVLGHDDRDVFPADQAALIMANDRQAMQGEGCKHLYRTTAVSRR